VRGWAVCVVSAGSRGLRDGGSWWSMVGVVGDG